MKEKSLSDLFSSSDEEFYQSMLNSPILKIKDREDAKDEILRYMIKQMGYQMKMLLIIGNSIRSNII